jgi:hypothetical protein
MDEYQKNLRDISEKIEKVVYGKKSRDVKNVGLVLVAESLIFFVFSIDKSGVVLSKNMHALIDYKLPSAIIFFALHVFTLIVLIIPQMVDKFQFATLFTLINIPLLFRVNIVVCDMKMPLYDKLLNLSIACFFLLMACQILFGLEATRQQANLTFFRSFGKLNAWIQKKFDEGKF